MYTINPDHIITKMSYNDLLKKEFEIDIEQLFVKNKDREESRKEWNP